VNWEIDFWGKFRRANEAARAEMIASSYSLRSIQISLISEVIGTYFLLLDYQRQLEISRYTLETRMKSLRIIQQRFDKGIIPEIDLNQAQIQKEIAEGSIPAAERLVSGTRHALSILLGRLPRSVNIEWDWNKNHVPPAIPAGLPSQLLERRPDIKQAEYQLQAQNARIGVAEAQRFPAISLTGIFGAASNELSSLTTGESAWSLSGSLLGPLFNFNKNSLRVEIEEERTKQALFQYENTVLNAFREVEDALVEVRTYQIQVEAVRRKNRAAKNASRLAADRYDKGVTSYLEFLDAERTAFDVELEFSRVKQQYANAYVRLYKALGGGWLSKEEMNSPREED
jgi:multidrug efflux system outer membrane protein